MHTQNTRRGFTLIELLVVVLIIGILAAVALPQYQKAVEKSRLTQALQNAKSLQTCFDLYKLEHGLPTTGRVSLADMNCSIELSLGEWDDENSEYMDTHFRYYNPGCNKWGCFAEIHPVGSNGYYSLDLRDSEQAKTCYTEENDFGRYICKSLESQGWDYSDSPL